MKDIKGVIPAMLTIFNEREEVDEQRTRTFVNHLISKKIDGLYIGGSTGECFLMESDERKKLTEIVIDEVAGRIPVIVHVADIGTKKTVALAEHAQKCGADAISSVPPIYFPFSAKNVLSYYSDICKSVDLPMVVYNIALAGNLADSTLEKLLAIKNVQGLKYTSEALQKLDRIREMTDKDIIIYSGSDPLATSGLSYGADGIIGSFYNLIPEMFVDIYNAIHANDLKRARAIQKVANKIIYLSHKFDENSCFETMRYGLSLFGVDAGNSMRPFLPIDDQQKTYYKEELKKIAAEYTLSHVDLLNDVNL